jgi:uncharacterized delta-60 repeat protein
LRSTGIKTKRLLLLGWLALAIPLAVPAGAAALGAPGEIDPTFHGGKPVLADPAKTVPHFTDFTNLLVDGAGRIVVAGQTTDANGRTAVAVARYSSDGAADTGFGEGGTRVTQFGAGTSPYSSPQSLFLVPGRYVGFGIYRNVNDRLDQSAYVIGENGAGDTGFGSGGLAAADWPPSPEFGATAGAAAAPDGTVYVSGFSNEGESQHQHALEVTKFTPEGKWGENFPGLLGTYVHKFGEALGAESTGGPIATMPDSSMVIAGTASMLGGGNGLLLVHLTEGGQVDPSFGQHAGYSIVDISDPADPDPYAAPTDILIGPNREIYVAAIGDDATGEQAAVIARFTPSGQPDFTFGDGSGIKRIQLGGVGNRSAAFSLALQPDGKVIVVGSVENAPRPRILRLRQDGSLDPSFGNGGIVTPNLGGEETFVSSAAVAGSRLLVSGSVKDVGQYSGAVGALLLESLPDQPSGKGTLRLRKKSFTVDAKGRVAIPLACSAAGPCQGRIALLSKTGKATISKAKKATTYAKAKYKLAAGAKTTVALKLGKPLRSRARAKAGLSARLAIAPRGGATKAFAVKLHR